MRLIDILFLTFCGVMGGAGIMLAITRRVVYAAFLLFVILFTMAALFVFSGAEFLAVAQIIVYVGGILILVLFGVMLTQKLRDETPKTQILHILPGLLASAALLSVLVLLIASLPEGPPQWSRLAETNSAHTNVELVGKNTVTLFLLPFEAISILLLAALIGAAYLSRKNNPKKEAS